MKLVNLETRDMLRDKDIAFWEVAKAMSVSESTFTRLMRVELSKEYKSQIKKAVNQIVAERSK